MKTRKILRGCLEQLALLLEATVVLSQIETGRVSVRETYCSAEGFSAACKPDEVLLIHEARYGRMYLNSCVQRDYGYIGCSAVVTTDLVNRCSGRQECTIVHLEAAFVKYNLCPQDLRSFLEATHSCVKVAVAGSLQCGSDGTLKVTSTEGFLSSEVAEKTGVGSSRCPWVVSTQPGLRINITLLDFSRRPPDPAEGEEDLLQPQYCRQYGFIRDGRDVTNVVRCSGDTSSEQHIYVSKTNSLEVVMYHHKGSEDSATRFIFKYQVVGCLPPILPNHMYVEGTGDAITVRCNYTDESSHLTCDGSSWKGTIANCSYGYGLPKKAAATERLLPLGVTIFLVLGVALLICVFILGVGLLHLKRTREISAVPREQSPLYGTLGSGDGKHVNAPRFATLDRSNMHTRSPVTSRMYPEGNYAHIWEIRRPPLPLVSVPQPCAEVHQDSEMEGQDPGDLSRTDPKRTSFTTFRPNGEHIYETPKFGRKQPKSPGTVPVSVRRTSEPASPFYFELDPKTGLPEGAGPRQMSDMPCNAPAISDAEIQDST